MSIRRNHNMLHAPHHQYHHRENTMEYNQGRSASCRQRPMIPSSNTGRRKKERSTICWSSSSSSFQKILREAKRLPMVLQILFLSLAICITGVVLNVMSSIVLEDMAMGSPQYISSTRRSTTIKHPRQYQRVAEMRYDDLGNTSPGENNAIVPSTATYNNHYNNTTITSNWNAWLEKDRQTFVNRKRLPSMHPRTVMVMYDYNHHHGNLSSNHHNISNTTASFHLVVPLNSIPVVFPTEVERTLDYSYIELRKRYSKELREADKLQVGDCKPLADWQLSNTPTCNIIHEASSGWQHQFDLSQLKQDQVHHHDIASTTKGNDDESGEQIRFIKDGTFRQVWMIRDYDGSTKKVMKTLNVDSRKAYDKRNEDRHRRDALSFAQLTSSPLIVNIHGYCSNSGLFDYADGGDLYDVFRKHPNITNYELLHIAYNISLSIHHAHNFDSKGRATIAHTDIKPDQFLFQDGYYQLSDFNRARFLTWDFQRDLQCGFKVGRNGGNYRSPEEYNYELETEKVDVYSMGNVLYFMLTKKEPWEGYKSKYIYDLVRKGQRPQIPDDVYNATGIYERYMILAMEMAWTHDFHSRPSALEISEILKEGLEKLSAVVGQRTIVDKAKPIF